MSQIKELEALGWAFSLEDVKDPPDLGAEGPSFSGGEAENTECPVKMSAPDWWGEF